ncbi:hypothetical protein [Novosphingobium sp.]|uniref:hypothetical protein n=1 Tax=Novosphingobium sp. TaxID=1874826 RepID=UPI00260FD834|nr:hypothetical protein [Novosphingobium sp.]
MGEILGLGLTHYPGPLVPTECWPDMLKQGVRFGMVPEALYQDKSRWPAAMLAELGDDEGISAAHAHHQRLMTAFARMRAELDAFDPDLVVIWGDDQYENYKLDCVPPFCVGIHDEIVSRPYGGGRIPFATDQNVWSFAPDKPMVQQGHFEAGHGLTTHLMQQGFDVSWARVLRDPNGLAHSFSNTIVFLDYEKGGQDFRWPVVPIHVNCYGNHIIRAGAGLEKKANGPEIAPPSPSPERCFGLGREVARYFAASPWRVALIGSSSWSHGNLTDKHDHMYPDVPADRQRLDELSSGAYREWGSIPLETIEAAGQHEVLNWIALAGAMAELDRTAEVVDFLESHLFNSSKCFAVFRP